MYKEIEMSVNWLTEDADGNYIGDEIYMSLPNKTTIEVDLDDDIENQLENHRNELEQLYQQICGLDECEADYLIYGKESEWYELYKCLAPTSDHIKWNNAYNKV